MSLNLAEFNMNTLFRFLVEIAIRDRPGLICLPVAVAPARNPLIIVVDDNRGNFVIQSVLHRRLASFDLTSHVSHLCQLRVGHFL